MKTIRFSFSPLIVSICVAGCSGGADTVGSSSGVESAPSGSTTTGMAATGTASGGSTSTGTMTGATTTGDSIGGGETTTGTSTGMTTTGTSSGMTTGTSAAGSSNEEAGGTSSSGGGSGGVQAQGGAGGSAGEASGAAGQAACADECPVESGVMWQCKRRFMYGVNYAWHHFAGDFGGITAFGQQGVSGTSSDVSAELADMASNGVNVVRWWVWPDFRGDGVAFSGNTATGLGTTTVADLNRALELADEHDLYLMLTLFSFDNFRNGNGPNLANIVQDSGALAALVENAVRPFAAAAEASPHKDRLIAWDVINEPEWAISGAGLGGDEAFDPNPELTVVSHTVMETFVSAVIAGLRTESNALTTVGGAAMKWAHAWSNVDIDFYQLHIYDWVNTYWPYDDPPLVMDKPVVMGEFPVEGLTDVPYGTMMEAWLGGSYAGAMGWAVTDATFDWNGAKTAVAAFADAHPCETAY